MALLADIASWILLLTGGALVVIGSLGLVRFPDFFTRMHSASITDTLGAGLIMVGLLLQAPDGSVAIRLLLIIVFLLFTTPTATHALAKAAVHSGLRPLTRNGSGPLTCEELPLAPAADDAEDTPSRL